MNRRAYPSDYATWRDALAFITPKVPASQVCACGAVAQVLRHDVEGVAEFFACVPCAVAILGEDGDDFYLWTGETFEPWENIVDDPAYMWSVRA
jgi:hypothetical protein